MNSLDGNSNDSNESFFIGAWEILSWEITESNSDKKSFPFGTDPKGLITYTADGWMSAAVSRKKRNKFESRGRLRALPDELLSEAYKSYFHYAGSYQLESDRVTHTVTMALNPSMVGTKQVRFYDISEGVLTLRGEEPSGAHTRYHTLKWRRVM